jgi:hypothetical protein
VRAVYTIDYKLRAFCICFIVGALCFIARHFRLDDALIYARYILHALQGRGLEFNPGEPVNALTSILNTWLLLGLSTLLRGHILLAQLILSGSFLVGVSLMTEKMVPLSGIFIAASSFFYFCDGMETSLFLFLIVLCVNAYVADKVNWLPLLCALTVLARFEGGAIVLVIAWQLWRRRCFPTIQSFFPAFLLAGLYLAFNLHYYGIMLPQSTSAKFGQGLSGFWGRWPTAFLRFPDSVYQPIGGSWVFVVILGTFAWFGTKDTRMQKRNEIIIPFIFILGCFYILFNIPAYHWYYGPFLLLFIMYAVRLIPETRSAQWAALLIAACLLLASARYLHHNAKENADYVKIGEWLNQNTPKNARIATTETGTIGWYCDRNIIDLVGLTTPQNAHFTAKRDFGAWFSERPDFVVVHPNNPFPWERVAMASPEYEYLPFHSNGVYLLRKK